MTTPTPSFELYTAARIVFGSGTLGRLPELAAEHGERVLLLLGAHHAERSGLAGRLRELLPVAAEVDCSREPRVEDVDRAVALAREARCEVVVAVGGGSVLDCGKAVSGMLNNEGSLGDYLEGVGAGRQIAHAAAPMIAVPTTSGTGSEVTKNAVISGEGYKKSVRSPLLIPRVALVDPELTIAMPPALTAACGMDALTQLIEAYLSRGAGPITDALALDGIARAGDALWRAYHRGDDIAAREQMALASLLGGVCLANAGLGAVHGFASPLGAFFPISHGVACAALLPQVLGANLRASRETAQEEWVWGRFARVSAALCGQGFDDRAAAIEVGLEFLHDLQRDLQIPRLTDLGLTDLAARQRVVENARGSSMRYNAVELDDEQLHAILEEAL